MGNMDGTNDCTDTVGVRENGLSRPSKILKICVTGAASLMGFVMCGLLKSRGYLVVACDWRKDEIMAEHEFWDEYHVVDLTTLDNCLEVTRGADLIFNFAATTGGLGFREFDLSVIKCNNTEIGCNMATAAWIKGVQRHFHASIVFTYLGNELSIDAGLTEPQFPIDFEKDGTESLCQTLHKEHGLESRIGTFYCFYGPLGAWHGGRGEAPGAFCLEACTSPEQIEMWGAGLQTCSFPVIRKYARSVMRLMESDSHEPEFIGRLDLRELGDIGSGEIVSKIERSEKLQRARKLEEWLSVLPDQRTD